MRNLILLLAALCAASTVTAEDRTENNNPRLKILFLGDSGPHRPADRFAQLAPRMGARGIDLTYTDALQDLNPTTLSGYEGLIIYANQESIAPDQETALLDYVQGGGGLIALHCASYCFQNSDAYIALVGAQFDRHGGHVFGTEITEPEHPAMQGFDGFRSWDETYIHRRENSDRTILERRVEGDQAEGRSSEPYTWVRTAGDGRVFYTAWGHDQRTWGNPGYINLVERGIRWATGGDPSLAGDFQRREPFVMPQMTSPRTDVEAYHYVEVGNKIPNYLAGKGWGTQGDPLSRMQRPLPPAESLKHYVTPVGFAVDLFVSETQLGAKPIAMTWDERGRLWVCETVDYPNELRRPDQGNDRITICEDTDGDFKADKYTVFAEHLSIPTAITCYRGGAIVQDGVRTLFLKDTDGDDVADLRHTLITGWELGDTHGGVSNFHYGLDNWIWAMQGYNNSRPKYAGGESGPFRMGFFRFKLDNNDPPNVVDLEFVRSTDNNTWGLGISEEGLIFGSTANRNPSVFMPIPNRYYERVRGWGPEQLGSIADTHLFKPVTENVRQVDHHGGYTAGAGHSLYTARRYPQQWWNRTALVNGPTGHLTGVFVLEPNGAGFTAHSPGNLLASDDEWSAPIASQVGPDGNVWVIDWYNYIVQHNPTPQGFETGRGNAYESDLRDKKHGRIVRVTYGEDAAEAQPRLDPDNPDSLIAALGHTNMLWRLQAQRLLVQRGELDVVDALVEMLADPSVDAIGLNPGAIHALWTLHGLGAIASTEDRVSRAVVTALGHPSAAVRRAAVQVLPPSPESVAAILSAGLLDDDDAQVRLATILALSDAPPADQIGERIATLATDQEILADRWLADAVTSAAAVHADEFLPAIARHSLARSPQTSQMIRRVAEHIARGRPDDRSLDRLLRAIASAPSEVVEPVFSGLSDGWPQDFTARITEPTEAALLRLADRLPPAQQSQLIALAPRLRSAAFEAYAERAAASLRETLEEIDLPDAERIDAARQLVQLLPESDAVVQAILEVVDLQMAPQTAGGMIGTLASSRSEGAGEALVEAIGEWTPAIRKEAVRLLLTRPRWTADLIQGLEQGQANLSDLALDQRQALASHPDPKIRAAATNIMKAGGGLPSPDRLAVIERYRAATESSGDARRGAELFKEHCGKCHRHGELGQEIGPDLTGMAVHPKPELLVHILDPSRSVEGNFRSYMVLTVEGRVLTGMLAGESKTTIELVDTSAKRETVPRADIEQLNASTKSVMPEGFEDQLDVPAMSDLLAFLTARGKYLPVDLRKAATLPTDRPMFYGGAREVLALDEWAPRQVQGVPFRLLKPADGRVANAIMLYGPQGKIPPTLPKQVEIPIGVPAAAIHMLSGVGGWSAKSPLENGPPVMTVWLQYEDGTTEDHVLRDGVHFADYIGNYDVPGSKKAFTFAQGFQMRYIAIVPQRPTEPILRMELIKNDHPSTPIVMAVTLESPEQ